MQRRADEKIFIFLLEVSQATAEGLRQEGYQLLQPQKNGS